jgi:pyruvate/2-oxoglutarate dehydrogenase complex dihydrolipoamide acyltransferase (E2) component
MQANLNINAIYNLSANIQDLAKKARDGKLQPHEFQGGTFT